MRVGAAAELREIVEAGADRLDAPLVLMQNVANQICLATFCIKGGEATMPSQAIESAEEVFRQRGGTLRLSQAAALGISRATVYRMAAAGQVVRLARGLYQLADMPLLGDPDLVLVMQRVPGSVICLVSALAFHNLTTQIPHEIQIAVSRAVHYPKITHPPVRVFRYQDELLKAGVETPTVGGHTIRVFSAEKTLADCFKYRNKIGLDIAIEALRLYWQRRRPDVPTLMRYAHLCRVSRVMRPYLEALQ
jgi:predicted transcriptional regulator of viral defense system